MTTVVSPEVISAEWSVESGRHTFRSWSFFATHHIFDYSYTSIIPAIACFLHFLATEDSLKARSSLESKCNASRRMESMTDLEGIFLGRTSLHSKRFRARRRESWDESKKKKKKKGGGVGRERSVSPSTHPHPH